MFIRKTRKKDLGTGKVYFSFQLVESVRTVSGPRQRILLNMGCDIELSDEDRRALAVRIEEKLRGHQTLLTLPDYLEELAHKFAVQVEEKGGADPKEQESEQSEADYRDVDVSRITVERSRSVGVEHVCLETVKKLRLDSKLQELGFTRKQVEVALGVVIGRLAGCCSDRGTYHWMRDRSALGELLETDFSKTSEASVYRSADRLLEHKEELEKHLAKATTDLFSLDNTIMLCDLTNTYFEGRLEESNRAQKGRSKEKRSDCQLVTLGLVVNRAGFVQRSDIFEGNISEPTTLADTVEKLSQEMTKRPLVILDAGFATDKNLLWLRQEGYQYIVCSRKRDKSLPADLQYEVVCDKENNLVEAATKIDEATQETTVYCRSQIRREGELAWLTDTRKKFEAELEKLASGLHKKGHTKTIRVVNQKIGRLKQRYKRLSTYYEIQIVEDAKRQNVESVHWDFHESAAHRDFHGAYLLRSHGLDWDAKQLWRTYILLTEIEEAFRCLKTDLGLRPIFHRKDHRIDAHLFTAVLAYQLLRTIQYQLEQEQLKHNWSTIRNRLSTQNRVSMKLPLRNGETLHLRQSTVAEPFQRRVYTALGIPHKPGKTVKTTFPI